MKKFAVLYTILIVLVILAYVMAGCQQVPQATKTPPSPLIVTKDGVKTYTNSKYNFTFNVCNNTEFELEENYGGATVAVLGPRLKDFKHRINVSVIVENLPKDTSFEDYLKNNIKEAERNLTKFAVTNETTTTISGIAAKQSSFTYTASIDDAEYVFQDTLIVFMKDTRVYAIKYDVPDEFHDQYVECFNLLISTFKFR